MKVYNYIHASVEHPDRCEDSIMVFPGDEDSAPVFAVIDGMGGHQHKTADGGLLTGRDASQAIREILIEDLERFPLDTSADPDSPTEQKVIASLQRANEHVFSQLNNGESAPLHERIGAVATVITICENGSRLLVTQIGDTRGYLFSEGDLIQICEDEDNLVYLINQKMLNERDAEKISDIINSWDGLTEPKAEGSIRIGNQQYDLYLAWRWFVTGNSALHIPGANVVVNSLGTEGGDIRAQRSRIEVLPGDTLLMCSDGLYKNLSQAEIIEGLADPDDPATKLGEAALARSQDQSNRRMNPDDISVIVVRF